jgi:hypothetical protein
VKGDRKKKMKLVSIFCWQGMVVDDDDDEMDEFKSMLSTKFIIPTHYEHYCCCNNPLNPIHLFCNNPFVASIHPFQLCLSFIH